MEKTFGQEIFEPHMCHFKLGELNHTKDIHSFQGFVANQIFYLLLHFLLHC